ncbi:MULTISPECIES: calcium/sodium antiporter [unclassified Corynebacterium]|uniref:calcium/sodium antiporter n=1 Tax=unclassified Corynebacterium TaxID=2624378 RepID=UPI0040334C43
MSWLLLLAGFAVLVVGGELLVRGASALSARMGISPMVVGLTVVAIGSSLPELAVGVDAAVRGSPGLVTGNIVGTNIVNLLLVLGLAAAIQPIITARQMLRLDLPAVAAAAVLLLVLSFGGSLTWPAGLLLLLVGVAYTATILWYTKRSRAQELSRQAAKVDAAHAAHAETQHAPPAGWRRGAVDVVLLLGGIALVILGADWLVTGAVDIASELGVSDALIGLTIVAVGTSAPELVTTVVATLRGQASMAVGNLIGSSVYNIVFILGATVLVAPDGIPVPDEVLRVDMLVLVAVSLLVVLMFRTGRKLSRWEGLLLVALYAVYLTYLVLARV